MTNYTLTLEPEQSNPRRGRGVVAICIAVIVIPALVAFLLILVSKGDFLEFIVQYGYVFLTYILALLLAAVIVTSNNQKKEVTHFFEFDEAVIKGNFIPFHHPVHWSEVESVLLRSGILTIAFRHKGVLQFNVLPPDFPTVAFELFCEKRISAYRFNS